MMRRLVALVSAIVLLFSLAACESESGKTVSKEEKYKQAAQKSIDSGDIEQAKAALSEGISATNSEELKKMLSELEAKGEQQESADGSDVENAEEAETKEKDVEKEDEKNSKKKSDSSNKKSDKNKRLVDVKQIESIIANSAMGAEVGVCVIDLKNGITYVTDNADRAMSASAMVNIPVLYTAFKDYGDTYNLGDYSVEFRYKFGGRGELTKDFDGCYFGLDYMLRQMLNYSDNNATNSLIDYFGREAINSNCNGDIYTSVDIQRYIGESSTTRDNYISAADLAEMLAVMYRTDNSLGKDFIRQNFRIYDDTGSNGLGKGLPGNVTFLNHNAITETIYNEVAIVALGKTEYVIAFMANNGTKNASMATAAQISSYVYQSLSK